MTDVTGLVIPVTVTQSHNIEKAIEDSRINNII